MKKSILILLLLPLSVFGQEPEVEIEAPPVPEVSIETEIKSQETFMVVEEMPEFPGGEELMRKYFRTHLVYPEKARELGEQGRVFVGFVVSKDGSITDVKILKGVSPRLDAEAIRLVEEMPKWKPGKQRGKAVNVRFNLPITFRLQ